MTKAIRTSVVGAGWMGGMHSRVLFENENAELVSIMDLDNKRGSDLAKSFGVKYTDSFEEVLEDSSVQAVVLCLPDHLHREATIKAIKAKKHILLEKPLATTIEDAKDILDATKGYEGKISIGHLLRYDNRFAQAKRLIQKGEIGDVIHISSWRNNTSIGAERLQGRTSIMFYLGVHEIDLIRWYSDSEVVRVFSESNTRKLVHLGTEDVYVSTLKLANGTVACMELSWCLPNGFSSRLQAGMEIVGTKGAVCIDSFNTGLSLVNEEKNMNLDTFYWPEVNYRLNGALSNQMAGFLNSILDDTEPLVSVEDAYKAVEVACGLTESSRNGYPVNL